MRNLIGGLNIWALFFVGLAFWLGIQRHPQHVSWAVFAAVFATFSQAIIFALFLGSAKLIKKHVGRFNLDKDLLRRLNELYFRLFPWAMAGSIVFPVIGILGGAAQVGGVPLAIHFWAAVLGLLLLLVAVPIELHALNDNRKLMRDIEAVVPDLQKTPIEDIEPAPGYEDDRQIRMSDRKIAAVMTIFGWASILPPASYAFVRWETPQGWHWAIVAVGFLLLVGSWLLRRRS